MTKTYPWRPAEHIRTREDVAAALEAALETGDEALVAVVLSDIARSPALKRQAQNVQGSQTSLSELLAIASATGLRLTVAPAVDTRNLPGA